MKTPRMILLANLLFTSYVALLTVFALHHLLRIGCFNSLYEPGSCDGLALLKNPLTYGTILFMVAISFLCRWGIGNRSRSWIHSLLLLIILSAACIHSATLFKRKQSQFLPIGHSHGVLASVSVYQENGGPYLYLRKVLKGKQLFLTSKSIQSPFWITRCSIAQVHLLPENAQQSRLDDSAYTKEFNQIACSPYPLYYNRTELAAASVIVAHLHNERIYLFPFRSYFK